MSTHDVNQVIENRKLTLSVSTPVKLVTHLDRILLKCYYPGTEQFIEHSHCKFCHEYQQKTNNPEALCKKHFALNFYNDPTTVLSDVWLRREQYIMFGRYVKKEMPNCTYIFYITPIHVDPEAFTVLVYPKGVFTDKKIPYNWKIFKRPSYITFSIRSDPYILDNMNKYKVSFKKL